MNDTNTSLAKYFRQTLYKSLEKIDINQLEERKLVYKTALRSLNNVHQKNDKITAEAKLEQIDLVKKIIEEIENKVRVTLKKGAIVPPGTTNNTLNQDSATLAPEIVNHDAEGDALNVPLQNTEKGFLRSRGFLISCFAALLLAAGATYYFKNNSHKQNTVSTLELPWVLNADDKLFKTIKQSDALKTTLLSENRGILYEAIIDQADKNNRLDFVLRGELAEKLNNLKGELLITFHIEKQNTQDVNLTLVVRTNGKPVFKRLNISDSNLNEYFLTLNADSVDEIRSRSLLRVQINQVKEKYLVNPKVLIKKIVFSKI